MALNMKQNPAAETEVIDRFSTKMKNLPASKRRSETDVFFTNNTHVYIVYMFIVQYPMQSGVNVDTILC